MTWARWQRRGGGIGVAAWAAAFFVVGLGWGLPSRDADRYLFGSRPPWTGRQIMALTGPWALAAGQGADRPMTAATPAGGPTVLNATDAQRAEIVRRYRLYSAQPDEMITFRSLVRMRPGSLDLDPRLYQYGGLWIYPVGGLLKLASVLHRVDVRTDLAWYLDHPAAFGRFYLVARGYSALWGLIGVAVVYGLTRQWTGRAGVGVTAAMAFAALPVVVNAAHEAKPHLAGAVLTLATAWAGLAYARTGRRSLWVAAGASAGGAVGMVLTGYAAFAVLPVMTLLRPISWGRRCRVTIAATAIGVGVFLLTNPYLPIDLLTDRRAVTSNVGNYGNFYRPGLSWDAIRTAAATGAEAASLPVAVGGVIAVAVLAVRRRTPETEPGPTRPGSVDSVRRGGLVLAAPAVVVLVQFVLLAAGKPAEYGRFAIVPAAMLTIAAAAAVVRLPATARERTMASALLVVVTAFFGSRYLINFVADGRPGSTRMAAAKQLDATNLTANRLAVWADPAPYGLPPVDLFSWRIELLPPGSPVPAGAVGVRPTDVGGAVPSPISWANKPFAVTRANRPR